MATTQIDEFGRFVVPEDIRSRLGLKPGTPLKLLVREGSLIVEPVQETKPLTTKGDLLVHTAQHWNGDEDYGASDQSRRTRTEHGWGL